MTAHSEKTLREAIQQGVEASKEEEYYEYEIIGLIPNHFAELARNWKILQWQHQSSNYRQSWSSHDDRSTNGYVSIPFPFAIRQSDGRLFRLRFVRGTGFASLRLN